MIDKTALYFDKFQAMEMVTREKQRICDYRARGGPELPWTGLALSGGGIRSAVFCLGALQALAKNNILGNFDYMSSVSGGGYIASALQWLWRQDTSTGCCAQDFPFGTSPHLRSGDEVKDARLAFLRWHGQYLTPGDGITIWSATAVVMRTLFLNLLVWLPLGGLALLLLIWLSRLLELCLPGPVSYIPNPLAGIMEAHWIGDEVALSLPVLFGCCLWIAMGIMFFFVLWAIAFSFDTQISPKQKYDKEGQLERDNRILFGGLGIGCLAIGLVLARIISISDKKDPTMIGAGAVALCLGIVLLIIAALQSRRVAVSANYEWRRKFEVSAGKWLVITILLFLIGSLPIVPYLMIHNQNTVLNVSSGTVVVSSGLISAFFGHRAQSKKTAPGIYMRWGLTLKRFPPELNRWDSQTVMDERVFVH